MKVASMDDERLEELRTRIWEAMCEVDTLAQRAFRDGDDDEGERLSAKKTGLALALYYTRS